MTTKGVNQTGQVVIILLLIALVSLTVGLAVVQRSITSVTTSNQSEQGSRAFSAAEAGIESATQTCQPGQLGCTQPDAITLSNQSEAKVIISPALPPAGQALEYPPLSKEETAQIWLSNPANPLAAVYTSSSFDLYFGNDDLTSSTTDNPAVEVTVITYDGGTNTYKSFRYYFDSVAARTAQNNFFSPRSCSSPPPITTTNLAGTPKSQFYCVATVPPAGCGGSRCTPYSGTPIMARVRILYSQSRQKIALAPIGGNLPVQGTIYTSTGKFGLSQKTISVFKLLNSTPPFFDFAIFSSGDIVK